jgi:rubrerythrin
VDEGEEMSNYGLMIGCKDALMWVKNLKNVNEEIRDRVVNRMVYEFEKDIEVPPKFHKGKYGSKYDSFTCGQCGFGVSEAYYKFCPNCGYRIGKKVSE